MIKHIVMWNLKEDLGGRSSDDIKAEMKQRLEGLRTLIPEIKKIEVGFNYNTSEFGMDVVLYSEFDSAADLDAYQVHPAHVEAAGFIKSVVRERKVADYEI